MNKIENIERRIKEIIMRQLGVKEEELTLNASIKDFRADSLDLIELIMIMEEELGIEISDEDAERITTIQDVMNYINYRMKNNGVMYG